MIEHAHGADMPHVDPLATKAASILAVIDQEIPGVFDHLGDKRHARLETRLVEELRRESEEPRSESVVTAPTRERDGLVDPDTAYSLRLPQKDVANA